MIKPATSEASANANAYKRRVESDILFFCSYLSSHIIIYPRSGRKKLSHHKSFPKIFIHRVLSELKTMTLLRIGALAKMYVDSCRKHGVLPNTSLWTALIETEFRKSHDGHCTLEILLDTFKETDFRPLLEFCMLLDDSVIEAVDVRVEATCALTGENALSLMQAVDQKLQTVELHDLLFGKQFLRELTQRGLYCQILNLRSSNFQKLDIVGVFVRLHTLNLDYSTSLTSFKEDCFLSMPNLTCLSMCGTRIANLWTTIAALSRLPSLSEVRFQNWLCYNDAGSSGSSDGSQTDMSELKYGHCSGRKAVDIDALRALNTRTEEAIRLLLLHFQSHDLQTMHEVSSDDSEVDFSINSWEYGYEKSSSAAPGWNSNSNMQREDHSDSWLSLSDEESSAGAFTRQIAGVSMKYSSEHASPICFEKHYREYMIASLPKLKLLDNLPVRSTDRERATATFSKHFEYLPYRRKRKESVVSILQNREIRASHSFQCSNKRKSHCLGKSQPFFSRSLCAAKMGSSAWPLLHSLSISGNDLGNGSMSFRPRQFEYHPCDQSLMVFGTLDGEVVVVNHESEKIAGYIPSVGALSSVLGLCWLKKYPSKLIAGSDNGSLKLYDIQNIRSDAMHHHVVSGSVTFDDFDQLTSVHVNSTDELFLASGYSRNVGLYDINSGRQIQMFTDMHRAHINVVKFSNHSPSVFATSSFDGDIKMWDLRQQPIRPCYVASSSKGNVMVCFSPDDHYLLASAVDNEVRQFLAADGRLNLQFEIAPTGSSQNYTRSYYMNRDYIISGSCDEHVVRVCCAQTGRRLRDVSLEGKGSGTSMFVQSLRGDPFRDFNMSILAGYTRPSSKSEIVKVNLLASAENCQEDFQSSCPSLSMGG